MKHLIYKELRLAIHPICYIFALVFPLMILIPSYPTFVAFIYVASSFPILFLGANKGQQSNDLLYSALLPVRKKDIVLARIISVTLLILMSTVVSAILIPFAEMTREAAFANASPETLEDLVDIGFTPSQFGATTGFCLIAYSVYNAIFFNMYYKNGKSIVGPTLAGIFVFLIIGGVLTLGLPMAFPAYNYFFGGSVLRCILTFIGGALVYTGSSYLIYKASAKRLENVDL